jgi:uncharacterized protein (DUF302 family)
MNTIEFIINQSFLTAKEKVVTELKEIGFGIITEIDMQATLKTKIDKDIEQYVILGACNPGFAYQALEIDRNVGIFLPCNVVLMAKGESETKVSIVDPVEMMAPVGDDTLTKLANEVNLKLLLLVDKCTK